MATPPAAAAVGLHRAHLAHEVHEKQQLAVGLARQTGAEAPVGSVLVVLGLHVRVLGLPVRAERRVGDPVMEVVGGVPVAGERVAAHDLRRVLPANEHVGQADRVGLLVDLLAEEVHLGVGVERLDVRLGLGEHPAGAARAVVDRADRRGASERVLVGADQQVDHQPHHLARGEVRAGLIVGGLGELADELLERVAHLQVADPLRVQVDLAHA